MRVLVVYYRHKSTFIQRDIDILSKYFEVDELSVNMTKDVLNLSKKIRKSDVVYIWFAGKHAGVSVLLAKIFGKKSVVVVGGYDAAKVPEISYGLWNKGTILDKFFSKFAIAQAGFVTPVSNILKEDMLKIVKPKNYEVVYNGVPHDFCNGIKKDKENSIVTVGYINRNERIKVKGIDYFIKIAKFFPEYTFTVMGVEGHIKKELEKIKPDNVKILEPVGQDKLKSIYSSAKVYCQLSVYESFGIAVVEAMQCGCIPVVTNRGALPEVVGDAGVIVDYGDIEKIKEGIKKALCLAEKEEKSEKAIERARMFSLERREKKLVEIIDRIYHKKES